MSLVYCITRTLTPARRRCGGGGGGGAPPKRALTQRHLVSRGGVALGGRYRRWWEWGGGVCAGYRWICRVILMSACMYVYVCVCMILYLPRLALAVYRGENRRNTRAYVVDWSQHFRGRLSSTPPPHTLTCSRPLGRRRTPSAAQNRRVHRRRYSDTPCPPSGHMSRSPEVTEYAAYC
jgi:hypothetical protein